jgi:hypothetical protein
MRASHLTLLSMLPWVECMSEKRAIAYRPATWGTLFLLAPYVRRWHLYLSMLGIHACIQSPESWSLYSWSYSRKRMSHTCLVSMLWLMRQWWCSLHIHSSYYTGHFELHKQVWPWDWTQDFLIPFAIAMNHNRLSFQDFSESGSRRTQLEL